jgi:hypothetical protein
MGRIVPLQRPERPRFTRLRAFSDSFLTEFSEVRAKHVRLSSCNSRASLKGGLSEDALSRMAK